MDFKSFIKSIASLPPFDAIRKILERGYEGYMEEKHYDYGKVELLKILARRETTIRSYLDRLRFVCNKFEITAKNTDRKQFDKLLHYIIPNLGDVGNLESAMKKQKDSNDDTNYKYYDSPVYSHRNKCSELCKVGAELEECLSPVLEKIHHKKWNVKKNPR